MIGIRAFAVVGAVVAFLSMSMPAAHAAPIVYSFVGGLGAPGGPIVTGTLRFDPDVGSDSNPSPAFGAYVPAEVSITLDGPDPVSSRVFDDQVAAISAFAGIFVTDEADRGGLQFIAHQLFPGDRLTNSVLFTAQLSLAIPDPGFLSDDSIPRVLPDFALLGLSGVSISRLEFTGEGVVIEPVIIARIFLTALEPLAEVPSPNAGALLLTALAALASLPRTRSKPPLRRD